jgi:hypothetical protein
VFADNPRRREDFSAALDASGFRDADASHYDRCFVLRRPMAIVQVSGTSPAITRRLLQDTLGEVASRIDSVEYDLNIDGLESDDGSASFSAAISASSC